jgi:hypothetical protein
VATDSVSGQLNEYDQINAQFDDQEALSMPINPGSNNNNSIYMLDAVLSTENLIEKLLTKFGNAEDEDLSDWNRQDPKSNGDLDGDGHHNISYLKMMNEINFREARMKNKDGEPVPISICARTGCHCSKRKYRTSDLDELGPGVNLYFKMLKYFSCCFFLFCIISVPSILMFINGGAYENEDMKTAGLIMRTSLGNMDEYISNTCAYIDIGGDYPAATNINFKCDQGKNYYIKEFKQVGMAFKKQTCTGLGNKMSVNTLDRCTVGSMPDKSNEDAILKAFNDNCIGKMECDMPFDFLTMFDAPCNEEIVRRRAG